MFGAGPGQLPSDAFMLGIHPAEQRRMMGEALEVILDLLDGKVVSRETDWFRLREGRLHVLPYQSPSIPVAVASAVTPSGPALAGRFGVGMLSLAASTPEGFEALRGQWDICEQAAAKVGKTVSRSDWRITCTVHVAETRDEAMRQAEWGIMNIVEYYRKLQGRHAQTKTYWGVSSPQEAVKVWTTEGMGMLGVGVVGTPEDVAARVRALQERSGGFGCFLHAFQNIAKFEDTKSSVELFARYVIPQFRRANSNRDASLDWANANSDRFIGAMLAGTQRAFDQHGGNKPSQSDATAVKN
jgi:limonene 1,2-monooxygenase